jgi:hypothetical protein
MAFIKQGNKVISFAEFQDVLDRDQRLFEANEGLEQDLVEAGLIRATERILSKIRSTAWWQSYYVNRSDLAGQFNSVADIPTPDANRIRARLNDFNDLCVYTALSEYVLPTVADFSNEADAERQKMGYYAQKAESLFGELVTGGDWYDFDNSGTITSNEKQPGAFNPKRIR